MKLGPVVAKEGGRGGDAEEDRVPGVQRHLSGGTIFGVLDEIGGPSKGEMGFGSAGSGVVIIVGVVLGVLSDVDFVHGVQEKGEEDSVGVLGRTFEESGAEAERRFKAKVVTVRQVGGVDAIEAAFGLLENFGWEAGHLEEEFGGGEFRM